MTPNDLIVTVTGLFPRAFQSEATVNTWLDTYRKTLGHLRPDQLREAWDRTIAKWEKTSPPMPKHILDNIPVTARVTAIGTKSMGGLAKAIPVLTGDLMREWWRANAHWFDAECEARALTESQVRTARWWTNDRLGKAAHYQAQLSYWRDDTAPAKLSDADIQAIFALATDPKNDRTPFRPNTESLKAAYVKDGKRNIEYDHHYSWMAEPDAS
jgi:hypothetical protein